MGFGPVPRQEFCDAVNRMICDAGEDRADVGLGIDAVELGGLDEGVDDGSPFAAGIRSCEQSVLAAHCDPADAAFSGVVVDLEGPVLEISAEG